MFFVLIIVPLYFIFVLLEKSDSTWKLAFRDGAKALVFWSIFFPSLIVATGIPVLLANHFFGEGSYWAGVFGTIGALAALAAFLTLVNKKFLFF
jgi:hypothetical protein